MADPEYELFAIRYATREARRSDHFIGGDPHDGPMPMDYFTWVAKGGGRTFVIDTGFNAEVSKKRKRTFLRCPVETLGALDIDVNAVEDVILTHLHYDHVGNFDRFPNARFHLQEREIAYATGRFMRYPRLSHSFEVEDVCGIVRLNYARRVLFYDGDAELALGACALGLKLHGVARLLVLVEQDELHPAAHGGFVEPPVHGPGACAEADMLGLEGAGRRRDGFRADSRAVQTFLGRLAAE